MADANGERPIEETDDSGILRVKRGTPPEKLAAAIHTMILKPQFNGRLVIRAAGQEPNLIASKALILANAKLNTRGFGLFIVPVFDVVPGDNGSESVEVIAWSITVCTMQMISALYQAPAPIVTASRPRQKASANTAVAPPG